MTVIDFINKISSARPYESASSPVTGDDSILDLQRAFESDRGRIINSAPIRRLQQKTQVFPLERNSAVRSRLTHSLEVQQIGRFIVQSIFDNLKESPQCLGLNQQCFGLNKLDRAIESLVEMACLMHDMGNPPFGHCGEDAINLWFTKNVRQFLPMQDRIENGAIDEIDNVCNELCHFDGNAQTIRLVHSLHRFNLTYCQTAAVLKYTRPATERLEKIPVNKNYIGKKVGYFLTETRFVEKMMNAMNMDKYCRHPLSYIMEAADDISYCLADLEDAVEKKILSLSTLTKHLKKTFNRLEPNNRPINGTQTFNAILDKVYHDANQDQISKTHRFFIKLRVSMVHPLVSHAAKQFTDNLESIYHGSFNRALLEDGSQFDAIAKTFKRVAQKHVFCNSEVETLELQGYKIIGGLLDEYRPLLVMEANDFIRLDKDDNGHFPIERRLFNKLSNKHVGAYKLALSKQAAIENTTVWEFYLRCRLLQDYISGMTDQFAFDEYKSMTVR